MVIALQKTNARGAAVVVNEPRRPSVCAIYGCRTSSITSMLSTRAATDGAPAYKAVAA